MQKFFDRDNFLEETLNILEIEDFGGAWALPKSTYGNTVICVSVASGSLNEPIVEDSGGIAHFLEHRLFWQNGKDVSDMFADLGVEINACTGLSSTEFTLIGSGDEELCSAIGLLFQTIFQPSWSMVGIEKEKDIIGHELDLYKDDPGWIGYYAALKSVYGSKRIAGEIAGTNSQLAKINLPKLKYWHELFYHPSNAMMFISGNSDIEKLFRVIGDSVNTFKRCQSSSMYKWGQSSYEKYIPSEQADFNQIENLSIARPQVFLVFPLGVSFLNSKSLLRTEIALELALDILFGPSGLVYEKLYTNGLISGNGIDYETQVDSNYGFVMVSGDTDFPNELCDLIYDSIRDLLNNDSWKIDLDRARKKALGTLVRSYESSEGCVDLLQFVESVGGRPSIYTHALINVTADEVAEIISVCLNGIKKRGAVLMPRT